jgi:hypothetical protein
VDEVKLSTNQAFHIRTALAGGLRELFRQLEERLSLRSPVDAYLAGGMAVHRCVRDDKP